uniref:SFRICE_019917 n=1 Tax=Spodoptera frugiperda TaxID=7108 RepID=A0A2H1VFV8_SPOFR
MTLMDKKGAEQGAYVTLVLIVAWLSSGKMSGMTGASMLRTRRKDVNVKPNRKLDRKSSRGMLYENEELRLRTININAEVERGQSDIKKLKRENEQLKREISALRYEYDRLDSMLRDRRSSPEHSDVEVHNMAHNSAIQCTPTFHHFNTLSDLGIDSETPCPAVALATTRPTRQSITTNKLRLFSIKKIPFSSTSAIILLRISRP